MKRLTMDALRYASDRAKALDEDWNREIPDTCHALSSITGDAYASMSLNKRAKINNESKENLTSSGEVIFTESNERGSW